MAKMLILLLSVLIALGGCITMNNNGVAVGSGDACADLSKPFVDVMKCENQFIEDILANTSMKTIYAEVCFIEGLLGEARLELMPAVFSNGLKQIKDIIEKAGGVDKPFSECDMMTVHGIRWRMADNLVQEAFRQYAPKVIQYLPVWLVFR